MPAIDPVVESALRKLHEAAGTIKGYIAQSTGTTDEPVSGGTYRSIIDEFLSLIREVVSSTAASSKQHHYGAASSHGGADVLSEASSRRPLSSAAAPTPDSEVSRLRGLVDLLTHQLRIELSSTEIVDSQRRQLTDHLEALRLDGSVVRVYQERIAELLRLLEAREAPTANTLLTIAQKTEAVLPDSRTAKVANELGRYTAAMKDKLDRAQADKAKLQSDLAVLLTENSILFDRVNVLEAQLGAMASSASGTLKELERQRVRAAVAIATPAPRSSTPNPARPLAGTIRLNEAKRNAIADVTAQPTVQSTIRIGSVVIDKDVAVWMSEMYDALASDPQTAGMVPPRPSTGSIARQHHQQQSKSDRPASGGALIAQAAALRLQQEVSKANSSGTSSSKFASHVSSVREQKSRVE